MQGGGIFVCVIGARRGHFIRGEEDLSCEGDLEGKLFFLGDRILVGGRFVLGGRLGKWICLGRGI